jgi:hypothetical protein
MDEGTCGPLLLTGRIRGSRLSLFLTSAAVTWAFGVCLLPAKRSLIAYYH